MMSEDTPLPRIFVAIAAYRDPECQWTVKDLFEKAAHPERITVGICWQADPIDDADCFTVPSPRQGQMRIALFHPSESKGAGWARSAALSMIEDEEYVLMIDAHMRFVEGWDDKLIAQHDACPTQPAVISAMLPGYTPPNKFQDTKDRLTRVCIKALGKPGDPQPVHLAGVLRPRATAKAPYPSMFMIGNFLFAPTSTFMEIPIDPHLYFFCDEICYSARLFTHGVDIYQPTEIVAYHQWKRKPKGGTGYKAMKDEQNIRSYRRAMHLLGVEASHDAAVTAELDIYGLGDARPMSAFWKYAGIDLKTGTIADYAKRGMWKDPPAVTASSAERIFVQIAAYRDSECEVTIRELFTKAAYPERISVGVCWQMEEGDTLRVPSDFVKQVVVKRCHYTESQGASWARSEAQSLCKGETYTLQLDAHMRFAKGWDEALIEELSRCPSEKPILTAMLPGYSLGGTTRFDVETNTTKICADAFAEGESLQLHLHGKTYPLTAPKQLKSAFVVGNFIFARSEAFQSVPIDPYIFFKGYEISQSARWWTHGWDFFQPSRLMIYHLWKRDDVKHPEPHRELKDARQKQALQRVAHLLGVMPTADRQVLRDLERYGLGTARSLEEFWQFAGVDPRTKTVSAKAAAGEWDAASDQDTSSRIFVQIASYRDPECQWTVRDLFEKAEHPERITVGICWQYVKDEDQHCFEIPYPRPAQVRVVEFDARESKGVCWARRETQKLWQGEEYTLVIDSHMRFTEGWDVKMIEELTACDSPKAIITCHPGSYTPPNNIKPNPKSTILRAHTYKADGNVRFKGEFIDRVPDKPLRGAFIAAGFMFSRADVIREAPYDPHMYFDQEELSLAVRFFTHGWNVYSSRTVLLYHYYTPPQPKESKRTLHWDDHKDWTNRQIRGRQRLDHLFGVKKYDEPETIKELEKYGLGSERTLEQFIEFSGLDVIHKVATERALRCQFIEGLERWKNFRVFIPELDGDSKPIPYATPAPADGAPQGGAAMTAWTPTNTAVKDRTIKAIENSYLFKEKKKQPGSLIMLSGGLDSVAMLYNVLAHTNHTVHAHHIELINKENRAEAENEALKKIIAWCQSNLRKFDYTVSRSDFPLGIGGGLDISLEMFTAGRVYNALGGGIDYVWTGHITTSWQELSEGASHFMANFTHKRLKPEWLLPFLKGSKLDIYESIPPELAQMCWSCRWPIYEGDFYRPCNNCHACKSMVEIQNTIEKKTGKKPFDYLARREPIPKREASAPLYVPPPSMGAKTPAPSGKVFSFPNPLQHVSQPFDVQVLPDGSTRKLEVRQGTPEGLLIIENYLEPEICKALTEYADAQAFTKLNVIDYDKSTKDKVAEVADSGRVTDRVSIDGMAGEILSIVNDVYCNRLAPFYKVNFEWYERPQILRYPAGGKYNQHADADHWVKEKKQWVRSQDRDYSVLVYLNEEYGGGELELVNQKYKFKPKTGMLAAFPADHKYLHAALPTTDGIRYVIVSWAAIMGSKRVREKPPHAAVYVRQKRF